MRESSHHSSIVAFSTGCNPDYTTRDAILPRILELYPVPHATLALVCITYLTSCGLQNYGKGARAGDKERRGFMATLSNDAFLAYTHRSWAHHARQCNHHAPVTSAASDLLLKCIQYPLADESIDFGGPLHVAAFYGLADLINSVAELQRIPNAQTNIHQRSPLMLAVQRGHPACAKALLSLPDIDAKLKDRYGLNALMHAAHHDHIECLQVLVEAPGIDINAVDQDGTTALIHAVQMGQIEAAKLLLGLPGIAVNAVDGGFKNWTALIHAASQGQTEVVKLLLGVPDIQINAGDEEGCSALIHAVREGSTEVVKLLVKTPGIDVNAASTRDGLTALSLATRRKHWEIAEILASFRARNETTSSLRGIPDMGVSLPNRARRAFTEPANSFRQFPPLKTSLLITCSLLFPLVFSVYAIAGASYNYFLLYPSRDT